MNCIWWRSMLTVGVVGFAQISPTLAQSCGEWLPGFGLASTWEGIKDITATPSGSLGVVGGFSVAGDLAVRGVAIFDPSTGAWSEPAGALPANFGDAAAISATPHGGFALIGRISTLASSRTYVFENTQGRWQTVGELSPFASRVEVLSNGNIVVFNTLTRVNNVACRGVAMWEADRQAWNLFGGGVDTEVTEVQELPDGDLVICGPFSTIDGVAANRVARWDVQTRSWSPLGTGMTAGNPVGLAVLPGSGQLFVSGSGIGTPGGTSALLRYDLTTSEWHTTAQAPGTVSSVAALSDGTLAVTGIFDPFGNDTVARYSPASNTWSRMGVVAVSTPRLAVLSNGRVAAASTGNFGGILRAAERLAVFEPLTATWQFPRVGFDNGVTALFPIADGSVLVGGLFLQVNGTRSPHLARYMPQTGEVVPFPGLAWDGGLFYSGNVLAVAQESSQTAIIGGAAVFADAIAYHPLAWLDLQTGTVSEATTRLSGTVYGVIRMENGDLLVAGSFNAAGSVPLRNLALYSAASEQWSSFAGGTDSPIFHMVRLPDGDIVIAGGFFQAGQVTAPSLARLDLETMTWTALGNLAGSSAANRDLVKSMRLLGDGRLLIAGDFVRGGSTVLGGVGILDPNANSWDALEGGVVSIDNDTDWPVRAAGQLADGDIVVTGDFRFTASGVATARVARFSTRERSWFPIAWDRLQTINSLLALPDNSLLAVGDFYSQPQGGSLNIAAGLAHWRKPCPGDFNCDLGVDSDDTIAFFGAWDEQDVAADINRDTLVDGDDVVEFFERWDSGC